MGTFAQGGPSFAIRGKNGIVALAWDRTLDLLRRAGVLSGRSLLVDSPAIMADMEEIGVLSRTLVQASMDAAHNSGGQRQQMLAVVDIEKRISASARLSLENSQTAAQMTEDVAREIDAGTRTIEDTNRNMSNMVKTVAAGAAIMEKFVDSIAEVNRVVGQIGGIARQTNLLALNAAVEASHAGSEGDGFNVIAHEIRLLADRASNATVEIGTTIEEMALSAASAGEAMRSGRSAADASIEQTVRVQGSLEQMRLAIRNLLELSKQVTHASAEQLTACEEVASTVDAVSSMVAGSTTDADAAAEMSIKMVGSAERVHAHLEGWSDTEALRRNKGRRSTDRVVMKVENQKADILAALSMLRVKCSQGEPGIVHGTMQLKGELLPGLYFGGRSSIEGEAWVDEVHARTGCGATVFVLAEEKFVRVVTNVKLPNGERASGTRLNPKGLAIAALRKGMSYFGAVYVLGLPIVAAYEPIFSLQGKVIGALYVGRPLDWEASRSAGPAVSAP